MVNLLSTVIGFSCFFKFREDNTIKIDNIGFRLHYGFTAGFLFLSTALLGLTDMFGKNIQCRGQEGDAPDAVTQYCWVTSTYTVATIKAEELPNMPGIGGSGG